MYARDTYNSYSQVIPEALFSNVFPTARNQLEKASREKGLLESGLEELFILTRRRLYLMGYEGKGEEKGSHPFNVYRNGPKLLAVNEIQSSIMESQL